MTGFVEEVESALGGSFSEQTLAWILDCDPDAMDAAWRSALEEGPISRGLRKWSVPCLIYAGADDELRRCQEGL